MSAEQIEYHDRINAEFAEAVYQEMASARYGIDFCCSPDLTKWTIKKELLDLNALQVNICPNPNNPAQPGDPNFVPGPCGRLDVTYQEQGGTITYVPCNSYIRLTETFGPGANGSDSICYDTNAGYTSEVFGGNGLIITESTEDCTSNEFCRSYSFVKSESEDSTIIYTRCDGTEAVIVLGLFNPTHGPVCIRNNEYSVTAGVLVTENGECTTEDPCRLLTFAQGRGDNQITYIDCNGVEHVVDLPEFERVGPLCVRDYSLAFYSETSVNASGDCTN